MNNHSSTNTGVGFLGLLAIVFITLKLTDYISWSWWWVTAPLWGPAAVVVAALAVFLLLSVTALTIKKLGKD